MPRQKVKDFMAEKLKIAIIGLGPIGTAAGLALHRYADKVSVVGHDKSPGLSAQAKKMGAVERTEWSMVNAVIGADRILLTLPFGEIRDALAAIAEHVQEGCVIVDTADVKAPVMQWASELLPKGVNFVGGHPIVVPEDLDASKASADLFHDKPFCLTPGTDTQGDAVRLAADLAEALGAHPFFLDPVEHDGMAAGVEHLPRLMAAALASVTSSSTAWRDMRKLAGGQFYASTTVITDDGNAAAASLIANREQAMRWLDDLQEELRVWRQLLADGDVEALGKAIDAGLAEGARWTRAHATGNWDPTEMPADMPSTGTFMRSLIGFGRLKSTPDKDDKKRR